MKFKFLKIDLSSNNTYNCHAATPHPIDFAWLEKNPGKLFNSKINVSERQMMLRNERNASCEQNCWAAEDQGAVSPRLYQEGKLKTHLDPECLPEIIDLTVNIDCNLTCSYCCKEYSSSWQRDLIDNGDYKIHAVNDMRYKATSYDRVLHKISQPELKNSKKYQQLMTEIQLYQSNLKKIDVTGGEPLLDNSLTELLPSLELNSDCKIVIYTGLGVTYSRLEKMLVILSRIKNLQLKISAENIGDYLEFNRFGNNWDEFQKKLQLLDQYNMDWMFASTISNLTIFGFNNFVKHFAHKKIQLTFAYQPFFMSPFVLDPDSKKLILSEIEHMNIDYKTNIAKSIFNDPDENQRLSLRDFLTQFVQRRPTLSLNIFPKSFLQWLELEPYVV